MMFSDTTLKQGIVEQMRSLARVDSTQWPIAKIVASSNNYMDTVAGYAIGADKTFQWDDTNHTKLPIGTTNLVANQSDYSFLTDEQGNSIITLTRVEVQDANGKYTLLEERDQNDFDPYAIDTELKTAGVPRFYDKIADNIIRIIPKPSASVTDGLKFYFQRTPSYFTASDTTKAPGVSPLLHRGFVIAGAYDCALTLGLPNLNALGIEMQREDKKMKQYFSDRNQDKKTQLTMRPINFR